MITIEHLTGDGRDNTKILNGLFTIKNSNVIDFICSLDDGSFLKSLADTRKVELLKGIESREDRQKILFHLAINYRNDPKTADEIFQQMEQLGLNDYFRLTFKTEDDQYTTVSCDSALHMAVDTNCGPNVFEIILKQVDVNHSSLRAGSFQTAFLTALEMAIEKLNETAFNVLLKAGADIYKESTFSDFTSGTPPLLSFLKHKTEAKADSEKYQLRLNMLKKLLDSKANVNIRYSEENSLEKNEEDSVRAYHVDQIPFYHRSLGLGYSIDYRSFGAAADDSFRPFDFRFAEEVLLSPDIDFSIKSGTKNETAFDHFVRMVAAFDQGASPKILLDAAKHGLDLLKTNLVERMTKRFAELEKLFSETRDEVHGLVPGLINIITQYAYADENFDQYATQPKSRMFLFNLMDDPLFGESLAKHRKLLKS